MSNVISFADATKALQTIAEENQLVSGMSVEEAAEALGYTKSASGMYIKSLVEASAESVSGTTATEVIANGAVTGASSTVTNLALVDGASAGTAEVVGVGSVALPVAACMLAAGGGYLIGKQLNKSFPQFFDHLYYPLFDFVTGNHYANDLYNDDKNNAPTIPMLFDANGKTYMDTEAKTKLKSYIDNYLSKVELAGQIYYMASNVSAGKHYVNLICDEIINERLCMYIGKDGWIFCGLKNATNHVGLYNIYYIEYNMESNGIWTNGPTNMLPYLPFNFANSADPGFYYAISVDAYVPQFPTKEDAEYYVANGKVNGNVILPDNMHLNDDKSISDDNDKISSTITKYTPVTPTGARNLTLPNGRTCSPVYLPSTSPNEMPNEEHVPETAPDPQRITPYINPVQPYPSDFPLVLPSTLPSIPLIPVPNPIPVSSVDPSTVNSPDADPSQVPQADPLPENLPDKIPDPTNTGKTPVSVIPPVVPPSSAKGLLHVYNPTVLQVDQFGEWLWTTFSGDLIDTVSKLFNNPMDAVIGLHELYCTPITSGSTTIKAGFLDSKVASQLVSSRYVEIKCGAISVPEYWGNYLDYAPYTKSYAYLPFIGIVELNTDDIVGSGVEITYRVDTYNGSCIAMITTAKPKSAEGVTYQFEGNCSVQVPITSGMMSAVQNALIGVATTALSAATTAAVTVATGGTALPASVMVGAIASGATKQGLTSKNMVQHSGSFGSSYGAMGIKIPFLIIKRPKQKVVNGYNKNYGYPSHKMVTLSTCTGYLRAKEVNVISPTATETEKKMIEECLKSGVFID